MNNLESQTNHNRKKTTHVNAKEIGKLRGMDNEGSKRWLCGNPKWYTVSLVCRAGRFAVVVARSNQKHHQKAFDRRNVFL